MGYALFCAAVLNVIAVDFGREMQLFGEPAHDEIEHLSRLILFHEAKLENLAEYLLRARLRNPR